MGQLDPTTTLASHNQQSWLESFWIVPYPFSMRHHLSISCFLLRFGLFYCIQWLIRIIFVNFFARPLYYASLIKIVHDTFNVECYWPWLLESIHCKLLAISMIYHMTDRGPFNYCFLICCAKGGEIFTCGYETIGQLGHGHFESRNIPSKVEAFSSKHVSMASCCMRHTLFF